MILLDTSVLSLAFRRRKKSTPEPSPVTELRRLVLQDAPLFLPGIVLQEILSGLRTDSEFSRLRVDLEGFPLICAEERDHVSAAAIANACRRAGLAFSTIDCLIAAIGVRTRTALFTTDSDFQRMAPHCGLRLHRFSPPHLVE